MNHKKKTREYKRIPVSVPLVYKTRGGETAAQCLDLSPQGIAIPLKDGEKHGTGEEVLMSISIPDAGSVECRGEIAWVDQEKMGIHFVEIPERAKQGIADLLGFIQRESELKELLDDIDDIEARLNNLWNSQEEIDGRVKKIADLLRDSSGVITDAVRVEAEKAPMPCVAEAVALLREELAKELSGKKEEFNKKISARDESDKLKALAICDYHSSDFRGSLCGVKLAVLSRQETWDASKCEQCIKFRNW